MINKYKYFIRVNKKHLHKVGKQWIVISSIALALLFGGSILSVNASANSNSSNTIRVASLQGNYINGKNGLLNSSSQISSNDGNTHNMIQQENQSDFSSKGNYRNWRGYHKLSNSSYNYSNNHISYNIQRLIYKNHSHLSIVPLSRTGISRSKLNDMAFTGKRYVNNEKALNTYYYGTKGASLIYNLKSSISGASKSYKNLKYIFQNAKYLRKYKPTITDVRQFKPLAKVTRGRLSKNLWELSKAHNIPYTVLSSLSDGIHPKFFQEHIGTNNMTISTPIGDLWKIDYNLPDSKSRSFIRKTNYIVSKEFFNYVKSIKVGWSRVASVAIDDDLKPINIAKDLFEDKLWEFLPLVFLTNMGVSWNTIEDIGRLSHHHAALRQPGLLITPYYDEQTNLSRDFHIRHNHFPSYSRWLKLMNGYKHSTTKFHKKLHKHYKHWYQVSIHKYSHQNNEKPSISQSLHHLLGALDSTNTRNGNAMFNLGEHEAKTFNDNIDSSVYFTGSNFYNMINNSNVFNNDWDKGFTYYMTHDDVHSVKACNAILESLKQYQKGDFYFRKGWLDEVQDNGVEWAYKPNDYHNGPNNRDYERGWIDAYLTYTFVDNYVNGVENMSDAINAFGSESD